MKQLLTLTFLSLFGIVHAQIPSYIPSNGLVGWWPFNGNANDESGNGNNGTVSGATLTVDRFGLQNMAYYFSNSKIEIPHASSLGYTQNQGFSVSLWAKKDIGVTTTHLMGKRPNGSQDFNWQIADWEGAQFSSTSAPNIFGAISNQPLSTENWSHIVGTYDSGLWKLFINGSLVISNSYSFYCPDVNTPLVFGNSGNWGGFFGSLDDIGIWNRALTEAEILALYEGCQLAITTQPQDQSVTTSVGTASFTVVSSSANATYQWQTNLGLGYQNISNAGQYSGATSASLSVSNLSMANDNQVFRCIVNDGSCADTTAEATLTIIDDAGIQNITVSSIKLYPNPVQDVLHIDGMTGKEFEFEMLSTDGKLLQKGKSQGEIAVKELKKGNYVLRIGQQQVAFVKQ